MNIVSWNCSGAFRKKYEIFSPEKFDVLVIQECENLNRVREKTFLKWLENWNYLWVGERSGIGVFSKKSIKLNQLDWSGSYTIKGISNGSPALNWKSDQLQCFLPFRIENKYTFLGVWTKRNSSHFSYIGQFWKYLQIHKQDLTDDNMLILGDFNSNSMWDKKDRWWNHSDVVRELNQININSLYHHQFGEEQGQETQFTFRHRSSKNTYHIDYVFLSINLLKQENTLTIGTERDWANLSDHLPLFFSI